MAQKVIFYNRITKDEFEANLGWLIEAGNWIDLVQNTSTVHHETIHEDSDGIGFTSWIVVYHKIAEVEPVVKSYSDAELCMETSPIGLKCMLSKGHKGDHSAPIGGQSNVCWPSPVESAVNPNRLTDRQLSVYVGEKLMGWKDGTLDEYMAQVAEKGEGNTAFDMENLLVYMPDYAGDIMAAWELVERFKLVVRVTLTGQWCAAVLSSGSGSLGSTTVEKTYAEAKTAARAICLAALKAAAKE